MLLLLPFALPTVATGQHGVQPDSVRAETPILLYVPIYARASAPQDFDSFINCTLSKHPFKGFRSELYPPGSFRWMRRPVTVDLLVVVSGAEPHSPVLEALRKRVERLSVELRYLRNLYFETTSKGSGVYDTTQTSQDWNRGPNEVFYEVFHEDGRMYQRHVQRYAFVHQLETDVCALAEGWLAAAVAPMHSFHVIISGSKLKPGSCMMTEDAQQPCFPSSRLDRADVMHHLNGNALYRVSPELQHIMAAAKANYSENSFDVALWMGAQSLRYMDKLYDNDLISSAFVLVPEVVEDMHVAFPHNTYLVHVPRRFRGTPEEVKDWCLDCREAGEYICRQKLPYTGLCPRIVADAVRNGEV